MGPCTAPIEATLPDGSRIVTVRDAPPMMLRPVIETLRG